MIIRTTLLLFTVFYHIFCVYENVPLINCDFNIVSLACYALFNDPITGFILYLNFLTKSVVFNFYISVNTNTNISFQALLHFFSTDTFMIMGEAERNVFNMLEIYIRYFSLPFCERIGKII